jgi:hypothetical protein
LNKYLPVILFAFCILIAVLLAFMIPTLWPAALAIAISGAAMALALRLQLASDTGEASEEIADLKKANADLRSEIQNTYSIIDELADVVEQIATVTADGDGVSREDVEGLRSQIASIQAMPAPVLPAPPADERIDEVLIRMSAVEGEVQRLQESHDATLNLTQVASLSDTVPAEGSRTDQSALAAQSVASQTSAETSAEIRAAQSAERAVESGAEQGADQDAEQGAKSGRLRSLIARAGGGGAAVAAAASLSKADAAQPETDQAAAAVATPAQQFAPTLAPVFEPDLGAPIAFILSAEGAETDDDVSALLKHGTQISEELEAAGREVLLFLRLPPKSLERLSVRRDIVAAVDASSPLQRRLTMLTTQVGFDATVQNTLMSIADRGCKFALENIVDWSLDLAGLAKSGLRFIVVDGLAMANSAVEQGGDPRRLAQALAAHDIALIGGSVANKADMDAVRSLEPTLVTGDGLGEARVLEATL